MKGKYLSIYIPLQKIPAIVSSKHFRLLSFNRRHKHLLVLNDVCHNVEGNDRQASANVNVISAIAKLIFILIDWF